MMNPSGDLSPTTIERLTRLADKLDGVGPYEETGPIPPDEFNTENWVCQTAACACGHAAADPWFRELGLSLKPDKTEAGNQIYAVAFKNSCGYLAVSEFFEIGWYDAEDLFAPYRYTDLTDSPKDVADRIRSFIGEGVKARENLSVM